MQAHHAVFVKTGASLPHAVDFFAILKSKLIVKESAIL